ncbi:MAG: TonB-dependent receptor plug domain-containing protein [Bacteroidota bacterium]
MQTLRSFILVAVLLISKDAMAQKCRLSGRIFSSINNESVSYAVAVLKSGGQNYPATSDSAGNFSIVVPKPGLYDLEVNMAGFKPFFQAETELKPDRIAQIDIPMEPDLKYIGEVTVTAQPFMRKDESPLSMRSVGVAEIKRNPGGNRDISKVLQSLPGVASPASFRNDLIVRGGSPNENRFYLDGIEIPNINHFATQGASGGPVGLLNVDFINEVDFYSGAFPANRGNALSSVLDIRFKEGRADKTGVSFALGATDLATTIDGSIGKHSNFIASYRRSYLQFLFAALELPFLPTYNDFQFKYKYKPDNKQEFNFIGLGSYDQFALNREANETESQQYILGNIPENSQWSYTVGASYKRYSANSFSTFVMSRNHLNNQAVKYFNNDESTDNNLILDYNSQEIENKFRFENTRIVGTWKFNMGVNAEEATYTNTTFNLIPLVGEVNYDSRIVFYKYGSFAQLTKTFPASGLVISGGVRMDANTFGVNMRDPLDQLSPRISISKSITDRITLSANTGRYFQLPAYTILGFRHNDGTLANTNINYIRADHYVAGAEYLTRKNGRFSVEVFYKQYNDYPFGLDDSVSIANLGSDFGVVGNEPADSRSKGFSRGIEFLFQQKLYKGFYGLLAYTYAESRFTNLDDTYLPSSWDFRHTFSLTTGKTFGKNWETGIRFRYNSGAPYTPYDVAESSLKANWDLTGQGLRDKQALNTLRTGAFSQLDFRIDKKYYFKGWSLDVYFDVQNLLNTPTELQPFITVVRDQNGNPLTDPQDPSRYLTKELENTSNTSFIPSIGIIVEL